MTKKRLSVSQLRRLSGQSKTPTTTKDKYGEKPRPQGIECNNDSNKEDDDDEEDDDDVDDDAEDESEGEDVEPAATATAVQSSMNKRKAVDPNEVEDLFPPSKKKIAASSSSAAATAATLLTGVNDFCNEKTVYIEGFPYEVTEEDIAAFFESCGCIESVRLPRWHDSNKLRGYGHVQFKNAAAAKKAVELDGKDDHIIDLCSLAVNSFTD